MGKKADFKTYVNANITTNGSGDITGAKHNAALVTYLADYIAWLDETTQSTGFLYTRLADDNTAPSDGEFSFNTAKTKVYIHQENSSGDSMSALFNIMTDGNIKLVDPDGNRMTFNVSSYSVTGSIYTFSGTALVSSIGGTLGVYTVDFDIANNSDAGVTPAARFDYSRQTDDATPSGDKVFTLSSAKTSIKMLDSEGADLFNDMLGGEISLVNKTNSSEVFKAKIVKISELAGEVFSFNLEILYDLLGTSTGDYVVNLTPSKQETTPNRFVYTRKQDGTTTLSGSEMSFSSGNSIMYLSEYYETDYDMIDLLTDMGKYGGIILAQYNDPSDTDPEESKYGVFRVTEVDTTTSTADIDVTLETITDEIPALATGEQELILTFIPSAAKFIYSGSSMPVEMSSSITSTPTAHTISFDNVDIDTATAFYYNFGTSGLASSIWADLASGNKIIIREPKSGSPTTTTKYAVLKLSGAPTVTGDIITAAIEDGNGQTNITDFTTETIDYVIEFQSV